MISSAGGWPRRPQSIGEKNIFLVRIALPAAGRPHTKMCETADFDHGWSAESADGSEWEEEWRRAFVVIE